MEFALVVQTSRGSVMLHDMGGYLRILIGNITYNFHRWHYKHTEHLEIPLLFGCVMLCITIYVLFYKTTVSMVKE